MPNTYCPKFHSAKLKGYLDKNGKFKKTIITNPFDGNNFYGLYRINGTIDEPKLAFKRHDWFSVKRLKLAKTNKNIDDFLVEEDKKKITVGQNNIEEPKDNIKEKPAIGFPKLDIPEIKMPNLGLGNGDGGNIDINALADPIFGYNAKASTPSNLITAQRKFLSI